MSEVKANKISPATSTVVTLGDSSDTFVVTTGAKLDINGTELILDADADTSITADTDDQIDIRIAGADDFQFTANTFTAQSGSTIAAQALTATTGVFSSDVTGLTLNATGDTSAGDNAAIGYTAAEGLILTGQGSTSDITIKNDADANVMTVATGTTVAAFASAPTGIITDQFHVVGVGGGQNNVTGDGTVYTVLFAGTELHDADGVFASPNYTASAAGKAHLSYMIQMGPYGSSHTRMMIKLNTSNRTYTSDDVNAYVLTSASPYNRWCGSFICDMDASDTAYITMYCTGSSKVLDVAASADCRFMGYLIKD